MVLFAKYRLNTVSLSTGFNGIFTFLLIFLGVTPENEILQDFPQICFHPKGQNSISGLLFPGSLFGLYPVWRQGGAYVRDRSFRRRRTGRRLKVALSRTRSAARRPHGDAGLRAHACLQPTIFKNRILFLYTSLKKNDQVLRSPKPTSRIFLVKLDLLFSKIDTFNQPSTALPL